MSEGQRMKGRERRKEQGDERETQVRKGSHKSGGKGKERKRMREKGFYLREGLPFR